MKDMSKEEEAVYMKAFSGSKAKTVKQRMADAKAALEKYRQGGEMRAVDQGVKDANISTMIEARRNKIDKESGY